jgi:hypothetical protein
MTVWLVYDTGTGEPQFVTSRLPDPLDPGHTAVVVAADQVDPLVDGYLRWDPATLALVEVPGWDPAQAEADKAEARRILEEGIPVLRQWAEDARNTTVTQGNAVATLGVVVDRLGKFFDQFADLLETQR